MGCCDCCVGKDEAKKTISDVQGEAEKVATAVREDTEKVAAVQEETENFAAMQEEAKNVAAAVQKEAEKVAAAVREEAEKVAAAVREGIIKRAANDISDKDATAAVNTEADHVKALYLGVYDKAPTSGIPAKYAAMAAKSVADVYFIVFDAFKKPEVSVKDACNAARDAVHDAVLGAKIVWNGVHDKFSKIAKLNGVVDEATINAAYDYAAYDYAAYVSDRCVARYAAVRVSLPSVEAAEKAANDLADVHFRIAHLVHNALDVTKKPKLLKDAFELAYRVAVAADKVYHAVFDYVLAAGTTVDGSPNKDAINAASSAAASVNDVYLRAYSEALDSRVEMTDAASIADAVVAAHRIVFDAAREEKVNVVDACRAALGATNAAYRVSLRVCSRNTVRNVVNSAIVNSATVKLACDAAKFSSGVYARVYKDVRSSGVSPEFAKKAADQRADVYWYFWTTANYFMSASARQAYDAASRAYELADKLYHIVYDYVLDAANAKSNGAPDTDAIDTAHNAAAYVTSFCCARYADIRAYRAQYANAPASNALEVDAKIVAEGIIDVFRTAFVIANKSPDVSVKSVCEVAFKAVYDVSTVFLGVLNIHMKVHGLLVSFIDGAAKGDATIDAGCSAVKLMKDVYLTVYRAAHTSDRQRVHATSIAKQVVDAYTTAFNNAVEKRDFKVADVCKIVQEAVLSTFLQPV